MQNALFGSTCAKKIRACVAQCALPTRVPRHVRESTGSIRKFAKETEYIAETCCLTLNRIPGSS